MVVSGYLNKEGESLTPFYNLITTKTTWLKHTVTPWVKTSDEQPASQPNNTARILHYASALRLISTHTTIPVPRLLGSGINPDGNTWIELERSHGVWLDVVHDQCRMPPTQKHVPDGEECAQCDRIARANARRFIADEVIPQLAALRSDTTGLEGLVVPPLWVTFHDKGVVWPVKTAAAEEGGRGKYVCCHGNLHSHSIMVHPETLHVMKIVDWEDAGYFPEEFLGVWSVERREHERLYEDGERRERLARLML